MAKILIVEDNPDFAYGLKNNLEIQGHHVEVVADGCIGLDRITGGRFDLVVLDLVIPGMNGLEVLKAVRLRGDPVRVIILSALKEEIDRIRGLRIGADDYMPKIFGLPEFLARVEACLRRPPAMAMSAARVKAAAEAYGTEVGGDSSSTVICFGEYVIDPRACMVWRGEEEVDLRPKEFGLLLALARHPKEVRTRGELLEEVWGYAKGSKTRTVDVHVAALRHKLEKEPSRPRHIRTVAGRGYRLDP